MIVIRVELHSAITGVVTELARMHICNVGGNRTRRNYEAVTFVGRSRQSLDQRRESRHCQIQYWPSLAVHVWNLVSTALVKMGYGAQR